MSEKLYDLSQLEELSGGSDEFVQDMLQTFLEHTPQQLDEMMEAYHQHDMVRVGELAHKVKPNIDLFAISNIGMDIRTVEEKGKAGHDDEHLKTCITKVEEVLKACFEQMKQQ